MAKIIIKDGSLKLEVDRKDLIEVSETPDGVVFNFKNGVQLHKTEQFMRLSPAGRDAPPTAGRPSRALHQE